MLWGWRFPDRKKLFQPRRHWTFWTEPQRMERDNFRCSLKPFIRANLNIWAFKLEVTTWRSWRFPQWELSPRQRSTLWHTAAIRAFASSLWPGTSFRRLSQNLRVAQQNLSLPGYHRGPTTMMKNFSGHWWPGKGHHRSYRPISRPETGCWLSRETWTHDFEKGYRCSVASFCDLLAYFQCCACNLWEFFWCFLHGCLRCVMLMFMLFEFPTCLWRYCKSWFDLSWSLIHPLNFA